MAKKSIKEVIAEAKTNLKNVSANTKMKIGAGLLAGSMLFGGLVGCAHTKTNDNKNEVETKGVETVEKVEAETNPVIYQTIEEQLASVTNRLAQILEEQGVSSAEIAKLQEQVAKCTTEAQMQKAINSMQAQIEKSVNEAIDEKIAQIEQSTQQPQQKPAEPSINVENDVIDLDALGKDLSNMYNDMLMGIRKDYHNIFIQAEKLEITLKNTEGLDAEKLDMVQNAILDVQRISMFLISREAMKNEQDKTGYVRMDVISSGEQDGYALIGEDKAVTLASYPNECKGDFAVYDGEHVKSLTESTYFEEDSLDKASTMWMYDAESYASLNGVIMSGFDSDDEIDYSYDIVTGYKQSIKSPESASYYTEGSWNGSEYVQKQVKVLEKGSSVYIDEDGKVAISEYVTKDEKIDGGISTITTYRDSIICETVSEKEFNIVYDTIDKELEQIKQARLEDVKE